MSLVCIPSVRPMSRQATGQGNTSSLGTPPTPGVLSHVFINKAVLALLAPVCLHLIFSSMIQQTWKALAGVALVTVDHSAL